VERVPVVSSVIAEVGYNAACQTLEFVFKSGAVYLYYFVPQGVHDDLMKAENAGHYFEKNIKGVYEHHRICEPETRPRRRRQG
jgi:KTSC domain